jgi:hypothetical protein
MRAEFPPSPVILCVTLKSILDAHHLGGKVDPAEQAIIKLTR